jgi:hypothetical protein
MSTLKLSKLQNEFLMLTQFHGDNIEIKLKEMNIDEEHKIKMLEQVTSFKKDLFEMANYKPSDGRRSP